MKLSDWDYIFRKNKIEIISNSLIKKPDFFYKYYSITDYNIDAIINSKFYFSHPLIFNDLFESSIQTIDLAKLTKIELIKLYDKYKEVVWVNEKKDYHSIKSFVYEEFTKRKADFLRSTLTFIGISYS